MYQYRLYEIKVLNRIKSYEFVTIKKGISERSLPNEQMVQKLVKLSCQKQLINVHVD